MQVYLLRHGISEEARAGLSDADRALTPDGRRKLRQTLHAAIQADVKPSLILSSPLKRAVQTAEIAKEVFGCKSDILRTNALLPGAAAGQVWDEIRVHKDETAVVLVGHNPLFDRLAGYLLGQPELQVDFKKGAILRLDMEGFPVRPKGILRWYLTSKLATNHR
ncbi:MAG TPA: phosphohistidine phosphatase SixA [Bryobacteraceae bacterium]|jgi:phosphohistidine phosphatase